jgi:peptidyl-tRNA hydrolase
LSDYVLGAMGRGERETAKQMVADAAEAVELIFTAGVSKAMSHYNRKVPPPEGT